MPFLDPALYGYCTDRQREVLESIEREGGYRKAAKFLGCHISFPSKVVRDVRKKAALQGYAPSHDMTKTVPDGYLVKGVSTLYGPDGEVKAQWVKSTADAEAREEAIRSAVETMCEAIAPVAPESAPVRVLDRLLTLYTFTDYHVGALAWHREGGADWDVTIAERMAVQAMQALVAGAPSSGKAVINVQGDFLHYDSHTPVTPMHHNVLDADSRFGKVADTAIRIIRNLVSLALQHHDRVELLICEGNHDATASLWLRKMFQALYENEPRISVNDSELPYYVVRHGQTMLCFHHGHIRKNDQLPLLFAAQFPKLWGVTTKRYCHTGHRHHAEEKEHSGMIVVQHPTLAARDAYAARGGWLSERSATAITYDMDHGRVQSNTVTAEMFQ